LFPLSNSVREGEIKGVSKKSPSLIHLREWEIKGVSENRASLTQFSTNYRWWLFTLLNSCFANLTGFTLLNKDTFNRVNIKPLRGLAEFIFSQTPPSLLFVKKRRAMWIILFTIFPLSNSVREGEIKGVSKKSPSLIHLREWEIKGVSYSFQFFHSITQLCKETLSSDTMFSFHIF
jgi:hypothetical protein